jgi:putative transcriptional regulator
MAIRILLSRVLGEQRVTQSELSRRTGIRLATINEMYHELNDRVNLVYLDQICDALHCELSDLLVHIPNQSSRRPLNKR